MSVVTVDTTQVTASAVVDRSCVTVEEAQVETRATVVVADIEIGGTSVCAAAATSDVLGVLVETAAQVSISCEIAIPVEVESIARGLPGPQGPPGPPGPPAGLRPSRTLAYDGQDRLVRVDYADGSYTDLAYDGQDRLESSVYTDPSVPQTVTREFTYDPDDLLTAVTVTIT